MNKCARYSIIMVVIILLAVVMAGCVSSRDAVSYVNPNIGGVGHILQPTRPTVQLPNQMIRMYPDRKDYLDDQIRSFPLTLDSHRQGLLFSMMPFTGQPGQNRAPISAWNPGNEIATPYYYSVWLEDYDVTLEFTPGAKTGCFRMTFPHNAPKHVLLRTMQSGEWTRLDAQTVTGVEQFHGMKAFVYGQFSQPFEFTAAEQNRNRKGGLVSWTQDKPAVIEFKYAISFISDQQAKANFQSEIAGRSFETLKADARRAWSKVLNQIEVQGGTESQRRTFYTALYRCYERMMDITEDGRYYSNYDKKIHTADRPFYVDDWVWDSYLAHHPLRVILNPDQQADMIQSYVWMYQQSGWLPTFPLLWGDNPCMNGFHSTIMILDAYRKGIRNFDTATAFAAMKKNAMEATMLPWKNGPACALDRFYAEKGYYPALAPGQPETEPTVHSFEKRQSVAVTLGHSYDDWALSQYAAELGHADDAAYFAARANNYKNLYWKEKGFFMPKDDQGNWIDIDPKFDGGMGGREYYDENNGWTYLWQVQHDIPGLMDLMGGKKAFEQRLDQLFREDLGRSKYELWARFPDFTGIVGQFSMGNEPSFHIPYLYNFTDSPWKTQKKIRMLLNAWFPDTMFGIPGDEDGGGMSAFVVFSCMGFYPVTPGLPTYAIGSPVFEKVTIHLPNGKQFTVSAPGCSETNMYIQQAFLNGKPLTEPWITHDDIVNGGELKLIMGPRPNKTWGVKTNG
ncbi:MAG TPA: GH92 family glycosyl hydrolase [Anaerohalosphaeraceae bacterium]|nr:GH92 family glycosyl hydrolase [Anaerohalosphaeraceae bacterium]